MSIPLALVCREGPLVVLWVHSRTWDRRVISTVYKRPSMGLATWHEVFLYSMMYFSSRLQIDKVAIPATIEDLGFSESCNFLAGCWEILKLKSDSVSELTVVSGM